MTDLSRLDSDIGWHDARVGQPANPLLSIVSPPYTAGYVDGLGSFIRDFVPSRPLEFGLARAGQVHQAVQTQVGRQILAYRAMIEAAAD